jgi:hypothetical protein
MSSLLTNALMDALMDACKNGNFRQAQKLVQYDVLNFTRLAFFSACNYGHLAIAKWTLRVNSTINVRTSNNVVFYWACNGGYLDIAKWLVSIDPPIDVCQLFCRACRFRHLKVAKWLQRIVPTFKDYSTKTFKSRRVVQLVHFINFINLMLLTHISILLFYVFIF